MSGEVLAHHWPGTISFRNHRLGCPQIVSSPEDLTTWAHSVLQVAYNKGHRILNKSLKLERNNTPRYAGGPLIMEDMGFANTEVRIAHWTPGRIRLTFRDAAAADQFARTVAEYRGVISAKSNSLTGSVLILYTDAIEDVKKLIGGVAPDRNVVHVSKHDVCTQCRKPIRDEGASDSIRRLLSLIGAILTGDLFGIVSWLLFALEDRNRQQNQSIPSYSLAA